MIYWFAASFMTGAVLTLFIHHRRRHGSWGRAWCRIVHRHTVGWLSTRPGSRKCRSCGRDWHVTY